VRTAQRRGAIEHYYRALKRPFFSDRDWKRLPQSARQAMSDVALQMIWEDVSTAIEEDNEALGGILEEAERIGAQSAKRLAKAEDDGIPTRLVMMHFEASDAEEPSSNGPSRSRRKR
jgi:hypothetical protein